MPNIYVTVTITQFDDNGQGRKVATTSDSRKCDHRYNEAAVASAIIGHLDDELRWQDENTADGPEPPEYTGGGR